MTSISIIVPIYNMEKLMHKCIDSILAQTFKDFELLLIDDGSTDRSAMICDEYQHKDPRIKVYHKSNGGLSDARNYGLARVKGMYVIFFDPDDWVDSTCLEELYEKALESDADVVMCDIFYNDKYRQTYNVQRPSSIDHLNILKDILRGQIYGFTVNKLIKHTCYTDFGLKFPKNIYGCEDQYLMCCLFQNPIKIAYLPKAFYHYMYHENSLSRYYDEQTYQMDLNIRDMFANLFEDDELRRLAYITKTRYIVHRAYHYGQIHFTSESFVKYFEKYRPILLQTMPLGLMRCLYLMAFSGYYKQSIEIFSLIFKLKQLYKKMSCYYTKRIIRLFK